MNTLSLAAIAPLLILPAGIVAIMLQVSLWRHPGLTVWLSLATLLLAMAAAVAGEGSSPVTPLLTADPYARVFTVLFCLAAAVTAVPGVDYLRRSGDAVEEFFLLLLLSTLGACTLAYASHLASLLLGLELLSVALYALVGYPDRNPLALEAAVKYLVLSGAASATLLFGFALLYAATGTLEFNAMGDALSAPGLPRTTLAVGALMALAGLAFKLSLVPFHLWTPDAYQGAPAPVTGFLASVAKAAVVVVLLRWWVSADLSRFPSLVQALAVLGVVSMLAGNLLALLQENLKRMLAYSSIAHMGYLMIVPVAAAAVDTRAFALEAGSFYLIAYTATTLAAFTVVASLESRAGDPGAHCQLQDLGGLFWRHPGQALLMLVAMLSLAGIPLTAGFLAKFYLVGAASHGGHWFLLTALVIGSAIGIYYYLRVVFYMSRPPADTAPGPAVAWPASVGLTAWLLLASVLLLGILPQPLLAYLASIL